MTEVQLRELVRNTVNACCLILEERKLHGLPINLAYNNEIHLPICIFKDPNYIILSLPRASVMSPEALHDHVLRAMASLADHRRLMIDRDAMNASSVKAHLTPKPRVFQSAIWQQYYMLFKGNVAIKAVYNEH